MKEVKKDEASYIGWSTLTNMKQVKYDETS